MLILAVSDLGRNPAAAVFDGHSGSPLAAIEEAKLERNRMDDGVPRLAIEYCLSAAGARPADVDAVAIAGRPKRAWAREETLRRQLTSRVTRRRPPTATQEPTQVRSHQRLRQLFGREVSFCSFEHHLCHAASAFYASDADRALILTLDGAGDMWSGLLCVGEGDDMRALKALQFPDSLGWLFAQVTDLIGLEAGRDEQKTQWLSSRGTADCLGTFKDLFGRGTDGLPVFDRQYLRRDATGAWRLAHERLLQLAGPMGGDGLRTGASMIARSLQDYLEQEVVEVAERYRHATGARHLCLAGGVFLNPLLVRALERGTGFDKVFVQPASGNPGTAIGAGYLTRKQVAGTAGRTGIGSVYLGPQFGPQAIKDVLDNCKLVYRYCASEPELLEVTASLLERDRIVAWYQGRMEFGQRALGNRAILASPFSPYVEDNLNRYIKHRKNYHPFVLSAPLERAAAYFDFSDNARFATSVGELRDGVPQFDQFAFGNRRVRLHTVERSTNPRFWALLDRFGRSAPAPVLVNTSFNLFGESLVCDPRAAVRSFYCSGIDALVIGDFVVVK